MIRQHPARRALALLLFTIAMAMFVIGGVQAQNTAAPTTEAKPTPNVGSIIVPIKNLQNFGKGQLMVLLYKKMKRVEVNGNPFYRGVIKQVTGPKITVTFKGVPYGEYAVAVMHDMDKDMEMDTNFFGIPDEDLGISNNVKGGPLGGPKWNGAKFEHNKAENRITTIKMWQCYD